MGDILDNKTHLKLNRLANSSSMSIHSPVNRVPLSFNTLTMKGAAYGSDTEQYEQVNAIFKAERKSFANILIILIAKSERYGVSPGNSN